ncbi:MAG: hypothetical protein LUD47_05800 [Clostridia bacterium]|nr:hypothetical protein [Clostridia bacterium]
MNDEIKKIKAFLDKHFSGYVRPFRELSYDSANDVFLVDDETPAFMYDKIKEFMLKSELCSADALYIGHGNYINFIEFKNGKNINNFKKNCMRSGMDSKYLYRLIMSYSDYNDIDFSAVKYRFVTVIDTGPKGVPSTGYALALANRVSHTKSKELLSYLTPNMKDREVLGRREYYDLVEVWSSADFDRRILDL